MTGWEQAEGETPIDPSGLKNRGTITTRSELAAVEALNINRAFLKYLGSRPSPRSAPFDFEWFLQLHHEMFGDVWEWAGRIRTHELNIGVAPHQVIEQLAALVDDLHSWSAHGHVLEIQAVWLHHRATRIHPFENGNGRWARLLADIWLKRHGEPIIVWPDDVLGAESEVRDEYLEGLRAADRGTYEALIELHQRFRDDA